jgi:hypothetical protein
MIQRDIRPHGFSPFLAFWGAVAEVFCGWLANSVELFLRRPGTLGIRYLSGSSLVSTFFIALFARGTLEFVLGLTDRPGGLLHAVPRLVGMQVDPPRVQFLLLDLYTYSVMGMGLLHLAVQWRVNQGGLRHHTYFSGEPVLMWVYARLPARMAGMVPAKTVYDPLVCVLASYAVMPLDAVLGNWLFFASVAMFVRARIHYGRARAAELDAFDALKEAEDALAAIRGLSGGEELAPSRPPSAAASVPAATRGDSENASSMLDDFMTKPQRPWRPPVGDDHQEGGGAVAR